jgi:hypothetical protein
MKLLREINEQVEYLTEADAKTGNKKYILEGIFLQGNLKNKNGRIYPVDVLENEVNRYNEQYVNKNRAYGELDHPSTPSINLSNASHVITELTKVGDNFIGKARVLTETTKGKTVKAIMDEGLSLGVSSRGMGALKEDKSGSKVVEQYFLTTAADIVADPSAPDAFPENVFENVEWILTNEGWIKQEAGFKLVQEMKQKSKAEREERFFRAFKALLNS